jgi:hypothetical protein
MIKEITMANICSYTFTPAKGFKVNHLNDADSYDQKITSGVIIGSRKWAPPLGLLQDLKATGRLEWSENGLLGLGYYDLENGLVIKDVAIDTPQNLKETLEALEAHPELKDGLEPLIDEYTDEEAQR